MLSHERRDEIALISVTRPVKVKSLSRRFGVSEMTIRRDLLHLEDAGVLERVHGGARGTVARPAFGNRVEDNQDEKLRIAAATAAIIGDGESLFLDGGSTAYFVAQALMGHKNLFVATNSLNAAGAMAESPTARVLMLGGFVRAGEHSIVGAPALTSIDELRLDTLVLGVGGIRLDRGLVYYFLEEVEVRRAMMRAARRVIVVADHSKFGVDRVMAMAPLSAVTTLVTGRTPDQEYLDLLAESGVELVVTGDGSVPNQTKGSP
jgi:DeoR/GlpR family transcriptional regulator of sugar metabolism